MLGKLFKLVDNVKKLDESQILMRVIFEDEVRAYIIDLNKIKQLFEKGITSEGEVAGYYSAFTEEITKGRKKAGEPYNFYDTGEFYRSFDVAVYSDGSFAIEANTIKDDGTDLQRKYRKEGDILGLTAENKTRLSEFILPKVISEIRRLLNA